MILPYGQWSNFSGLSEQRSHTSFWRRASLRPPGISASKAYIEEGWYDEKWALRVNPVLREYRHLANELIKEKGCAFLSNWLKTSSDARWKNFRQQCDLVFSPVEKTLVANARTFVK
jgi:hypothetical protein